jgi:serine/threonine protein kinase/Tfp pilus assembly protein PilF
MSPNDWQKLEELFNSAVSLSPSERVAFIADKCQSNETLRRELEMMLAHDQAAGEFIESPAYVVEAKTIADDSDEAWVGQSFGQYQIVRVLGRGGMGVVYLAFDEVLRRNVALKFLHDGVATDTTRLFRFKQEARAASALNHPNILTIFDFGDNHEHQFTVTEYVEGVTLRERMMRQNISLKETLDLCSQIASALAAAHAAGIIHRDIKPENIMLRHDGLIKILDFGLAKLADTAIRDLEKSTEVNTTPGMVIGTVQYMSPEQLRGQKVDGRTDIWSLGVILYEMLAGRPPFSGETQSDMIAMILQTKPAFDWRTAACPAELEWILKKALAKDHDERYQSVKELLIDLKRLAKEVDSGIIMSALPTVPLDEGRLIANGDAPVSPGNSSSDDNLRPRSVLSSDRSSTSRRRRISKSISSIAIIPFVNLSGDPGAEYLSDGITESIINNLSQLPRLRVMARSTVFRYKGSDMDPQEIGNQLGVHAVLTGRVLQVKGSLVISTELVRIADGSQLWGQHFNRQAGDIFAVQEEIARQISEKLHMQSSSEDKRRLAKRHTQNAEAYQLYLKGRYFWNKRTPEGFQKAIPWFDEAARKDPNYALAHAGLADCSTLLNFYGVVQPKVTMSHAKSAVQKAIEADEALAEVHSSAAMVAFWYDWDWLRAEIEFERAIKLNPAYASAHEFYGWYLAAMGQDRAVEEGLRAIDLDPLEPAVILALGKSYYFLRRFDEAIDLCRRTLSIDPDFVPARFFLGQTFIQKGKFAEALSEFDRGQHKLGETAFGTAVIARAKALAGERETAARMLTELEAAASSGQSYVPAFGVAMGHAALENTADALVWLERACDERSLWMVYLNVDPVFDSLRQEPRFQQLIDTLNFAPKPSE